MAKAQKKNTEQVCWLADGAKAVKVTRIGDIEDGLVRVCVTGRAGRRFESVRDFLLFPSLEVLEKAAATGVPVFISNCHSASVKAASYDIVNSNYRITEKPDETVKGCRYGVRLHATRKAAVAAVVVHLEQEAKKAKEQLAEEERHLAKVKLQASAAQKALVAFKRNNK